MRRAGVLASASVMMSFSRSTDALLWMRSFAAAPEFWSTTPLTISLSLGFRLMASGILLLSRVEGAGYSPARLRAGLTRGPRTGGPKAARPWHYRDYRKRRRTACSDWVAIDSD